MATRKEMQDKRDRARMYYMQGESQRDIAERVGVSEVTVSDWAKKEDWRKLRAGSRVTRTELINKNLELIAKLQDGATDSDDPVGELLRASDQISKLSASIERLDKKANVVNEMESFANFNKWLRGRVKFDKALSLELLKDINKYQDIYVGERMNNG